MYVDLKNNLGTMKFICTLLSFILSLALAQISSAKESIKLKCRCYPNEACWPSEAQWEALNKQVDGRLIRVESPFKSCAKNDKNEACRQAIYFSQNPFYLESQAGATQTTGWLNAWQSSPSLYAVKVKNNQDIQAAVNFARRHRLRVVIKGTGHDYLGRSNAPNSLLIWTHDMRKVSLERNFKPLGCPLSYEGYTALTVSAGTRWLEAYRKAVVENGRYVQGGGCTSVGAAGGFIQGGGYGSFSKKFGIAASHILQAEIITSDGQIRIANRCQNQDLFWALKGGGGGTFGVVSHLTIKTHPLPKDFGFIRGKVTAKSDKDYKKLIKRFLIMYREHLNNPHWGEQIALGPDNSINVFLLFQNLKEKDIKYAFLYLNTWLENNPQRFTHHLRIDGIPARKLWDYHFLKKHFPELVTLDNRPEAPKGQYWWTPNQGEVSSFINFYKGRYLPNRLLNDDNIDKLTNTFFDMSRLVRFSLHFNKGLANASDEAIEAAQNTAINPKAFEAVAFVIISSNQQYAFPSIPWLSPDINKGEILNQKANLAFAMLKNITPNAGTYGNEADYFEQDWQKALWGKHYPKLLKIKNKYDRYGLFYCHHCVGSEYWVNHGMCIKP